MWDVMNDIRALLSSVISGGKLATTATIDASDIELGAVELKDGASNNRAAVSAGGALSTADAAILAKLIAAPATEAKQDALIAANHTDLAALLAKDEAIRVLLAAGIGVTGPLTDTQLRAAAVAISAAALPLPAGAAKDSTLTDGTQRVGGTVTVDSELPAGAALSDAVANPTAPQVGAAGEVWDAVGAQWVRARQYQGLTTHALTGLPAVAVVTRDNDGNQRGMLNARSVGDAEAGYYHLPSGRMGFDGTNWQKDRIPTTFKTVLATAAGDTALWTPASGKKVRLLRYAIYITGNATIAGGGQLEVVLRDSTTGLAAAFSTFVPAVAATALVAAGQSGWVDLGQGILSAAANNVLNVNLSAALATGEVRVVAIGTEE